MRNLGTGDRAPSGRDSVAPVPFPTLRAEFAAKPGAGDVFAQGRHLEQVRHRAGEGGPAKEGWKEGWKDRWKEGWQEDWQEG